ncbi:MAG: class I lanthipeptide [Candidatus Aminicenantes bacterium]|jgi:natural product precursor
MKPKKKLFLKKMTISNLSEKHMNNLRGGDTTVPPPGGGSRENGFCPDPGDPPGAVK